MQRFASLAFGMTYLQDFYYNICYPSSNLYPVSFNSDWTPNAVYGYVAQANQEIKCLSPSLSRLVSTGVTMLPGKHVASFLGIEYTANNSLPSGVTTGQAGAGGSGDYLSGVTRLGFTYGGDSRVESDILITYLKPLMDDNSNRTFDDGLHFMVVNGLGEGTAHDMSQSYRLNFDVGSSGIDSLVWVDRSTGHVASALLTYDGTPGKYHYDLTLSGGTGELFRYWDSSTPMPTIPEPSAIAIFTSGLLAALGWARRYSSRSP